jgi:uncharacterized protein YmfQ (DUF2313 family)
VELLGRCLDTEQTRSCGSLLYEKLLQEYGKAIKAQNMQNVTECTEDCMDTIAELEKDIKLLKVDLANQYKINTKLSDVLKAIRENTLKEIERAWS